MTTQRWKWDAEAAFKKIERHAENKPKFVECGRTFGKSDRPYTPPPNVAAWLKAQADKPKPHGRDYEALRRAAFEPGSTPEHPIPKREVGYWEDAPRGMKFGGGGDKPIVKAADGPIAGGTPAAPTSPLQSADGPWPKYALSPSSERKGLSVVFIQAEAGGVTTAYYTDGTTMTCRSRNGVLTFGAICTDVGAIIRALEQNGHADAAAQLRGKGATKPRDDVATGARVWRCIDGWLRCNIGAESFMRRPDRRWERETLLDALKVVWLMTGNSEYTELHGPERDAIVAECRKAMGI